MEQASEVSRALHGTLASLRENLAVLDILDGAAESWPGVSACMEAMASAIQTAAEMLLQKARAHEHAQQRLADVQRTCDASKAELQSSNQSLQRISADLQSSQKEACALQQDLRTTKASLTQERKRAQEEVWQIASLPCNRTPRQLGV